jgi:hypothetical protein
MSSTSTYNPPTTSYPTSTAIGTQRHIPYSQFSRFVNPTQQFYKVVRNDMIHYGMHYTLGLNVEKQTYDNYGNPTLSTGLSFVTLQNITDNLNVGGSIAFIKLCEDGLFSIENGKYKTNKFVILSVVSTVDFLNSMMHTNIDFVKTVLTKHPCLYYFLNQTREFSMQLILANGAVFKYIKNPSDEMIIPAVQANWRIIQYLANPSPMVCSMAVSQNYEALKFIKNPPDELCKKAIDQNPMAILNIENPTMEMLDMVLKKNPNFFKHVEKGISENLQCLNLQKNGMGLQYIEKPTTKMYICALKQTGLALKFIKPENQTNELCNLAVNENPLAIEYVADLKSITPIVPDKTFTTFVSAPSVPTPPQFTHTSEAQIQYEKYEKYANYANPFIPPSKSFQNNNFTPVPSTPTPTIQPLTNNFTTVPVTLMPIALSNTAITDIPLFSSQQTYVLQNPPCSVSIEEKIVDILNSIQVSATQIQQLETAQIQQLETAQVQQSETAQIQQHETAQVQQSETAQVQQY